jgi:isopentenyl phosphate kinase
MENSKVQIADIFSVTDENGHKVFFTANEEDIQIHEDGSVDILKDKEVTILSLDDVALHIGDKLMEAEEVILEAYEVGYIPAENIKSIKGLCKYALSTLADPVFDEYDQDVRGGIAGKAEEIESLCQALSKENV